jgi:serine protease Do
VLAAALGGAVTAAAMMSVQPARAQEPRVVVRSLGSASIGVGIRDVTSDDATKARLGQPTGVYVESVREGSPAAKAGVQAGDIVVDFDGERVRSASHFTRLVQESVPDREVTVVVVRGTSKQNLKIAPSGGLFNFRSNNGRIQRDLQLNLPRGNFNFNLDNDALRVLPVNGATLGVTVSPLSEQLASYFGVKQGVLVSAVTANSPAAGAGVRAGDVITAINGQNVSSSGDVSRALRDRTGESVEISVTRDKKSLSLKATIPGRTIRTPSGRGGLPI